MFLISLIRGNDQGWKEPVIEERFDPDRTTLTLEFEINTRTNAKKTSKAR